VNNPLITSHSIYWLLLIISISALLTIFLYKKYLDSNELSKTKSFFLASLRFIGLSLLGFLLLSPFIKIVTSETQKPIIIYAQDNSSSMVLSSDSTFLRDSLSQIIDPYINKLSQMYDVRTIQFGDSVSDISFSFTDKETNFENLFNQFNTTYFNQNIGAIIIASDGIYNKGIQPWYTAQGLSFPIYTLAFGDTIPNIDLSISKVDFNTVVYKGSNFPVRVGVSANLMKGSQIKVDILDGETILASENITINTNTFFKNVSYYLKADSAGVFNYKIVAHTNILESNILNNIKSIYVEVEENKRKILLLQNAYHPDIAVFKRIIDSNPAFEIEINHPSDFIGKVDDYALVIMHQLPSEQNNLQKIWPEINKKEIPVLFILGKETSLVSLNNLNLQVNINQKNNLFDDVLPHFNKDFNLFNLSLDDQFLSEMPPLFVPFGDYTYLLDNQTMIYQQMGQIETQKPLWAFTESGNQKFGFIMGEGIWKWSLKEYKEFRDHSITNEMVIKTIQYLALKNKNNPFVIEYLRTPQENQEIVFNAKLLNASNELVKGATIQFELLDNKGNKYTNTFKESTDDYNLNLGALGVGTYKFNASTELGNKTLTKTGIFIVKENLIEQSDLVADHNMLYKLSMNSNGKCFEKDEIAALFNDIEKNTNIAPISYSQKSLKELIHLKKLLLLLVLVFSLEWFLRKIWGLV